MKNENVDSCVIEDDCQNRSDSVSVKNKLLLLLSNFSVIVFIISILGLLAAVVLWAFNSDLASLIAFLTCLFTCFGYLTI